MGTDSTSIMIIPQITGPITFDGLPFEHAWDNIEPVQMIMHSPVFGKEITERTDIRIAHDDKYIYAGARFYDRDPSKIQITSKKRDDFAGGSDFFALVLDTYDDNENAVTFMTNPAGLRTDMTIFNDAEGMMSGPNTMPMNESWNTFWDVETEITDEGWFVEMRIPLSSLRFQDENGRVKMGLILWRWIPHLNEIYTFPAIPQNWNISFFKPSQAQDVVLEGVESKRPLYITPYTIGGFGQEHLLNDDESAYIREDDPELNAGIDIKFGVTNNLTLDLTLNTDFAQVEADDQMVNLTRFSLFFPEKRQFFLERASIFDFNTGGPSTLFYSRRIGLNEEEIIPIIGGVRLIGRQGPWDIGFLDMQTVVSDSLPSENFGVIRLKRRVFNENSYIGNILTSRLGMDGSYNIVYGFDGLIRVIGDEYLKLIWAQSFEDGMGNNPISLNRSRFSLNWERRKTVGFTYNAILSGSGPKFDPGIGFESRQDYTFGGGHLHYGWLAPEESSILKQNIYLRSRNFFSVSQNKLESMIIMPGYGIEMKNFLAGNLFLQLNYENVFEAFELSDDAEVPVGEYRFVDMQGILQTPMSRPLMVALVLQAGSYYDGKRISCGVQPQWSLSSSFELSGFYEYNWVDFPGRDQKFIAHIGRLKALYMFSTKLSASAFIQYSSADKAMISNFRFRYNPREGNDFYIVYNEGTNTELDREIPTLPRMSNRTLLLKYTYTFVFNQ
ncbi:MAG: hypothetical protein AMS27_04485 [Bacteroides sp. SM23_62_1]|nr:MAG: hypothetical protein AMS27_04485 [Bacteroides sp. SM23_62_1]